MSSRTKILKEIDNYKSLRDTLTPKERSTIRKSISKSLNSLGSKVTDFVDKINND